MVTWNIHAIHFMQVFFFLLKYTGDEQAGA